MVNDPRITRVGSFIRKTSLDELGILVNVLKGDMSIVGRVRRCRAR
ncbi:MAG: sugar transferase [Christensenellales bacterium]